MSQRQILNYLFLLVNSAKVIHEFISSLMWKTLFFYLDVVTEERSMWTVDRHVQRLWMWISVSAGTDSSSERIDEQNFNLNKSWATISLKSPTGCEHLLVLWLWEEKLQLPLLFVSIRDSFCTYWTCFMSRRTNTRLNAARLPWSLSQEEGTWGHLDSDGARFWYRFYETSTDRQTESQHIYVVLKCLYEMRFTSALTNIFTVFNVCGAGETKSEY